jgi:hypothetical protein
VYNAVNGNLIVAGRVGDVGITDWIGQRSTLILSGVSHTDNNPAHVMDQPQRVMIKILRGFVLLQGKSRSHK